MVSPMAALVVLSTLIVRRNLEVFIRHQRLSLFIFGLTFVEMVTALATDVFYQDFVTLLSFFLSFSFYKECPSEGFFEDILSYPIPDGFGLIYNDV